MTCKLLVLRRGSCRYAPRPDGNVALGSELVALTQKKPRYGDRRLHILLLRRRHAVNVNFVYRLYAEEGSSVCRKRRRHPVRDRTLGPRLTRPNQEWALDCRCDRHRHPRRSRVRADGTHPECSGCVHARVPCSGGRQHCRQQTREAGRYSSEGSPSVGGRTMSAKTRVLSSLHGVCCPGRRLVGRTGVYSTHPARPPHAERLCRELRRQAARRMPEYQLVQNTQRCSL